MWIVAWGWLMVASASEPETGALTVEVADSEDSWAVERWLRGVRRSERRWERASRRSDAPVPEPVGPPVPWGGLPIPGAVVEATGPSGQVQCSTNDDGVCTITALLPGRYQVVVRKPGFVTTEVPAYIRADYVVRQRVALALSNPIGEVYCAAGVAVLEGRARSAAEPRPPRVPDQVGLASCRASADAVAAPPRGRWLVREEAAIR